MGEPVCFLNGEYLPLDQARIPVLDRGFIFGDGVYEVIPSFGGKYFRLPEHLARLHANLDAITLPDPYSLAQWIATAEELLKLNGGGYQSLYLQVSRGAAPRKHTFPNSPQATIFCMCSPLEVAEPRAIRAITCDDNRWQRCDIKSISLLANVLAREEAARKDAGEAIFIDQEFVTEGASSNVFVAIGGAIRTPPLSNKILPGITRALLLELFKDEPATMLEAPVTHAELLDADEVWITSSTRELVPVVEIDGCVIGSGTVGPLFAAAHDRYLAYKAAQ